MGNAMREGWGGERGAAQRERDGAVRKVWRDERGGGATREGGVTR
jgi:hypothetical protein